MSFSSHQRVPVINVTISATFLGLHMTRVFLARHFHASAI